MLRSICITALLEAASSKLSRDGKTRAAALAAAAAERQRRAICRCPRCVRERQLTSSNTGYLASALPAFLLAVGAFL